MGIGPTRCMEKEEERRKQFEDLGKGHWPRNFSGLGLLRLDRGGGHLLSCPEPFTLLYSVLGSQGHFLFPDCLTTVLNPTYLR